MRRAIQIAYREYLATVATKGFIIGLILAPLMMCGGFIGVAVMQRQTQTADQVIALLDRSGMVTEAVQSAAAARSRPGDAKGGKGAGPMYRIEVVPAGDASVAEKRLELSDRVRSGELHAFVEVGPEVLALEGDGGGEEAQARYYGKNPVMDEARGWIADAINDQLRRERLRRAGVNPEEVGQLLRRLPLEGMSLVTRDASTGEVSAPKRQDEVAAIGLPLAVALFGMLLIMMGTGPLLQSVMEEKTQRIAEVMLGAATPGELMFGKVLGGVAVSMTAMALYVAVAFIGIGSLASASAIPWRVLPWFVVFVVAAIFMYGSMGAALGAACSDAKDAQHLQLPVYLPVIIPMFLLMPVIKDPQGGLATWMSLTPPFTPLLMIIRVASPGGVPAWEPWAGLAGVALATAAALWIGGRIFRVGILMQGKTPRFSELVRWGLRG